MPRMRPAIVLWRPTASWTSGETPPARTATCSPPDANAQPSLLKIGNAAIVRFDGIDDQLRAVKLGAKLDSFTIVIVAAPRQNLGAFAAFMALNAANERDYTSGLNVDLGPTATAQFSVLNVEGRGFGGAQNLRTRESNFAGLHTLVISSDAKDKTFA